MPEETGVILSLKDCEQILFQYDKNATIKNYEINKMGGKVFGFLAAHFYVTINYVRNGQNGMIYKQRFFLKAKPNSNEVQKRYIENMGIFKKEILNYKNFISEFVKLVSQPFAPQYYYSKGEDCLVIEDLSMLNYKVCNMEYLDQKKCIGALKALSKLHAGTLIYEELRSTNTKGKTYRLNEHFPNELIESTFSFREGHVRNKWCKTVTKCLEGLSKFYTTNEEVAVKIKEYIFSDKGLKKYLKPSNKYRNTLCHDDLWCNNMMFNENDECMLLDFQLTRYTPPVFDVLLLLYLGTRRNYLMKNMSYLLDLYYNSLSTELARHDLNCEDIISKSDFLKSVDEYSLPALVEAAMYATNVYLPEDVSSIVVSSPERFLEFTMDDRPAYVVKEFQHNYKYRERYNNVLEPLFQIVEKM